MLSTTRTLTAASEAIATANITDATAFERTPQRHDGKHEAEKHHAVPDHREPVTLSTCLCEGMVSWQLAWSHADRDFLRHHSVAP